MSKKDTIIKGTFILTLTGFLSRFIGFFYRIFLSHTFGEEGVGLYQLIFPVFALGFSFTTAGIEVALARMVAQKSSLHKHHEAKQALFVGLALSFALSLIVTISIQPSAVWIAEEILGDIRCANLLIIISYAFPFASIHSCISGYYLGLKQTKIPAVSQLIEQTIRVLFVYIISMVFIRQNHILPINIAVLGLVLGEIASSFHCILMFSRQHTDIGHTQYPVSQYLAQTKELVSLSIPLTASRVLLNVLQSIEAVSIPGCLILSGLNSSDALSIYGVLMGMAMPCILFPSAITSSISTMLLPTIAEVQTQNNFPKLTSLIRKVNTSVFLLGCFCTAGFLLTGNMMGRILFHSDTAGKFIITLAWICPFLYSNSTLFSILNGLGKTTSSLLINIVGLLIRIVSVFFFIPVFGIIGYLWGLLLSQLVITLLSIFTLKRHLASQN